MSEVKLVALRSHPFGTGTREKDEEYEATQSEADVLVALGWSRLAGAKAEKVEKVQKPATPAKKQGYKTRDLKAKG